MAPRKVIIDADPGVDDAHALLMALKSHVSGHIKIEGITVVYGNCRNKYGARNVGRILGVMNVTDVPIFKGSDSGLVRNIPTEDIYHFHGVDGFNCLEWNRPEKVDEKAESSASFISNTVERYPKEVTIICLGPMTNLALAYKINPLLFEKMEALYFMGGNFEGLGNTMTTSEYNFWMDPEAAFVVLNNLKDTPTYCVPWETCYKYVKISYDWRKEFIEGINSPAAKLMNYLENADSYSREFKEMNHWILCDQLIMAAFLEPETVDTFIEHEVTVELDGKFTRGQMVIIHEFMPGIRGHRKPIRIINRMKVENLKDFIVKSFAP